MEKDENRSNTQGDPSRNSEDCLLQVVGPAEVLRHHTAIENKHGNMKFIGGGAASPALESKLKTE